jgi:hypothetical protein
VSSAPRAAAAARPGVLGANRREASFEQLPKLVRIQSEGFAALAGWRGVVIRSSLVSVSS